MAAETGPTIAPAPSARTFVVQPRSAAEEQVQTFSGTIMSKNGKFFVLRDDANSVWYHLDNQKEASKFFGKKVLVTGTLDGPTDTIRIQTIQEA